MNSIAKYIRVVGLLLLSAFAVTAACLYFNVPARFQNHSSVGGATATYTCPMHPDVVQDHVGDCPKCGMTLMAARTATVNHANCEHEGGADGCCAKPGAMRLPPGHPPINLQLPPGHPPVDGLRTNIISWMRGS